MHECYLKLGQNKAEALIGWYAFNGTDNTGAFVGKGISRYKIFLRLDMDILDAFLTFGITDLPNDTINQMENMCVSFITQGGGGSTNAHCKT